MVGPTISLMIGVLALCLGFWLSGQPTWFSWFAFGFALCNWLRRLSVWLGVEEE
jgi:hypothetical protein